ncbi:MAG: ATP-binding protein [Planctomycetes bacterium]|nr:ATP-binding protein [Planctomycetota bacterium]
MSVLPRSAPAGRRGGSGRGGTRRPTLEDPKLALESLDGLVIIDEVQLAPDLFPLLRVLADRRPLRARFLVLGGASPALLRQSSESLAGRIAFHQPEPLDLAAVGATESRRRWLRGALPRSWLAPDDAASHRWLQAFTRTYLERDLSELGIRVPSTTMRRFRTMLAHDHGQTWNAAELARVFGVSERSVDRCLDIRCATFMARRLQPWFENAGNRQVRSPEVYSTASGILHHLLGIHSQEQLEGHPKVGASFEGFAIQQVVRAPRAEPEECFTWGLHTGAELDLLAVRGGHRLGFELGRTSTPKVTRSMRSALETLGLGRIDVIWPGDDVFPLAENVRAVGLEVLWSTLTSDRGV